MFSKKNYEKNYIKDQITKYPNVDQIKMETTIFAFGLLDELVRNNVPLIFKGGTSLLLLLDNPKRVSTDIDIIVPSNFNFDKIFERVKKKFPFYQGEERGLNSNKLFRHFYFMFEGPISNKQCRINLDVAFEDNPYPKIIQKELSLPLIQTTGQKTNITLPSIESILGDKLTAFAPTTIGVHPFKTSLGKPIDNRLQVMKQFYDIARLIDAIKDYKDVLISYEKCQMFENEFRETNYSLEETLMDTFNHAAEIASMGVWNKGSPFYADVAKPGIQGLTTNIFDGKYNQLDATKDASKIMLLISILLSGKNEAFNSKININKYLRLFKTISDKESFEKIKRSLCLLKECNYLK